MYVCVSCHCEVIVVVLVSCAGGGPVSCLLCERSLPRRTTESSPCTRTKPAPTSCSATWCDSRRPQSASRSSPCRRRRRACGIPSCPSPATSLASRTCAIPPSVGLHVPKSSCHWRNSSRITVDDVGALRISCAVRTIPQRMSAVCWRSRSVPVGRFATVWQHWSERSEHVL